MKKILSVLGFTLVTAVTNAQPLQNQHKCIEWSETWSHCAGSYTQWCLGAFDTLCRIQNTPGHPFYFVTYDWATSYGLSDLVWPPGANIQANEIPDYGDQPNFAVNDIGVGITELGYEQFTGTGVAIYPNFVDTVLHYVQQETSGPAEASVGFTKTMVAPDSVLIHTKTRFNIDDSGMFNVAVYVIQDSAMGYQSTTIPGVSVLPHRNMIMGAVQYNTWTWGYPIGNDTMMHAGAAYFVDFSMHIPSTWNLAKLSYLVIVSKTLSPGGHRYILNVTDGNFPVVTTGLNTPPNRDLTSNMNVFPVPARSFVNVEMQVDKPLDNCNISLYNINGKKVAQLYTGTVNPAAQLSLQLPPSLPAGNYMLQLKNESVSAVKQLTVQ